MADGRPSASENLSPELLQTLIAIADTGGFASAARTVHRTQSAVSMQMKRLEEIVGQALFEKQGRRAALTPQGRNLLLYARRIVRLQDEALAAFRSPEVQGEVRVGVCDDYVMRLMPPILAGFAERHPGVHIRLDSQSSDKLIVATTTGELDFSLVNIVREDIEHERLVSEPLVWVSSRRHLVHERSPVPVAIEGSCLWGRWASQTLDHAGVDYRLAYSTFSFGGIVAIVEAGLAVAVMSRSSVPDGLRVLSRADGFPDLPVTSIGLVRKASRLSPAAVELLDDVRRGIGGEATEPGPASAPERASAA